MQAGVLTPREVEILGGLAAGYTRNDVARVLGIGLGTVKTHINRAHHKLRVHNSYHAVAEAARTGQLDLRSPWPPTPAPS